jgi:hypothetical protein
MAGPLSYIGGKNRLAKRIIQTFPEAHDVRRGIFRIYLDFRSRKDHDSLIHLTEEQLPIDRNATPPEANGFSP